VTLCMPVSIAGHGIIYEPPARGSFGLTLTGPGCHVGGCLWFNEGCTIGCSKCTGTGSSYPDHSDCDPIEPTIKFEDKHLRTYALDDIYKDDDWTKHHPWRYPGSAPVEDACGISGGWYTTSESSDTHAQLTGWGVPQGERGSNSTFDAPLIYKTQWVVGSQVEVAWGIQANHGGGYQYRLCPASEPLSEECFQRTPLAFVGNTQWLQYGWGNDRNNRTEIPAVQVGGDLVIPAGSSWRRNPIPPCNSNVTGGAHHLFNPPDCTGPTFEPPVDGAWGYGVGSCGTPFPWTPACTHDEIVDQAFDFGIVDKVVVPDVPPGDYVVGFRWDSEQSSQVWSVCADVTIVSDGANTKPFSPTSGCHACCPETKSICSNCTGCVDDKTGPCAYCWNPLPGYAPNTVKFYCLGFEAENGGAPEWHYGDQEGVGYSPGCPKCWADEAACQEHFRPLENEEVAI